MTDAFTSLLRWASRPPFRWRYRMALRGYKILTALVVLNFLLAAHHPAAFVAVLVLAVITSLGLTVWGLLCPSCLREAMDTDESGIPRWQAPPERCAHCDADLS